MSNDIYKILNNFNKLTEQKPESARSPEAKPKTKLQENIEQIDSKYTQYRQTLMEMDKSQKPPGRDGASTDTDAGPQGVAKPIKSSDMARHAGKTLNKAVKKSRGLKETQQGVAEGSLEEVSLDLAKRARDKAEYFVDMDYDDMRYRPYGYSEKQRSKFQRYIDRKEPRAKGDRDWDPPKKKGVAEGTAVPWQVVINALASGYPDSDPTDSLAPIMRKYGVEFDDLNLLARRNGYNDIYAVLDDFGQKQGVAEGSLNEFAPGKQGGDGDYLRTLASAWYNDTFNTGSLQQGIKSQEDVERVLARGIVCPDGKTRKYNIDYNGDFDGVQIYSDDYYEHGDVDGSTDTRTGRPFGPYDHIEFKGQDLDEGVAEGVDIGREWMSDTELDQYVPDDLQQEWSELFGYDSNGMPHPLWANMTGGYEPDVYDPQHRRQMVRVANKWFAMKRIPNVKFYNVKDADDELEWLVQIGPTGVAEGSEQKTFKVVYYSPGKDRNITKTIKANNESDVWDQLKAKGTDVVSVKNQEVAEERQQCPECGGPAYSDRMLAEKQDACYHKVKSRYKVWPSAYASGALVQCRKKGAKNWGTKSESARPAASKLLDSFKADLDKF